MTTNQGSAPKQSILIIEDETVIRTALVRFLQRQGFDTCEAGTLAAARRFDLRELSLIVTDLRLPDGEGTDVIGHAGNVPVLVMTSYASLRSAVDTMKRGAAEYIAKPFNYDEMLSAIRHLIAPRLEATRIGGMQGSCPAMLDLFSKLAKIAPTSSNVLIVGESGTGKELVAQALHAGSAQSQREMISLNCAAIPDTLIESELFGHEKGAFTGATQARVGLVEAADGSTLFLDEIGELPLEAQARLLRVLQEGEVRKVGSVATKKVAVRLIAATHRDLRALTRIGEFREDLYYRLHVMKLTLPPLRERGDDLLLLASEFLSRHAANLHKPNLKFASETITLIQQYRWPGNIRELENSIERAAILADGDDIKPDLLAIDADPQPPLEDVAADGDLTVEEFTRQIILTHQDHMTETELAQKLGISRKNLWEKRQRMKIPRKRGRKR